MKPLGYDEAIEAMRKPDARVVKMNGEHYVVPGGRIERAAATKVMSHPLVRAGHDGLFPGHDQTWRMINDNQSGAL